MWKPVGKSGGAGDAMKSIILSLAVVLAANLLTFVSYQIGQNSRQGEIDRLLASQQKLVAADQQLQQADKGLKETCAIGEKAMNRCVETLEKTTRAVESASTQLKDDQRVLKLCQQYAENHQ